MPKSTNCVRIWDYIGAPQWARYAALQLSPARSVILWIAHTPRPGMSPSWAVAHLSRACIDWQSLKVFARNMADGSEIRIGVQERGDG